jgi:hypothetical protein
MDVHSEHRRANAVITWMDFTDDLGTGEPGGWHLNEVAPLDVDEDAPS